VNPSVCTGSWFFAWFILVAPLEVRAAGPAASPDKFEPAFRLVREAVESNEVPGAIALVARDGKVLRHEAYGLRDVENRLPFTTNTLCWIASITKPVTVAAAMTLVDQGKLGLDDPVEKYLPEFRDQTDTDGVHHPFTIRQIMSHTSGLVPNPPTRRSGWPIGGPLDDFWLQQDLAEIVRTIARSPLRFKPGGKFEYSNSALFVLGRVMEVVSGRSYAAYVKQTILEPLGMTDTHYAPPLGAANRVAVIYAQRDGKRETIFRFNPALKISNAAPDGGLFSYPGQLVPFLQMFMNNDGRVLSRAAVREMLKEQPQGWGLGWSLPDGLFLHEGSSGTLAWGDPKTGVIGLLFLQYRDKNDSDARLRKQFREAVQSASAEATDRNPAGNPGARNESGMLPAFWKSRLSDIDVAAKDVKKGQVQVLTKSAGARNIYLVTYGAKQDRHSTANYNSAVAGGDPASYARKDGNQRPVIFFLGPVHGQELEGVVGLLNLVHVAETGRDFRGRAWPGLSSNLARCRVLIVPCGNPDGRARCAYDSWVGEELTTHERAGMGTKPDGSNHTWPQVKRLHPMRGPQVATLGAYWNDDTINLMHDEWFDPMAPETRAWFELAREEAPDFIVSLHSHAVDPSVEPTAYVPRTVKETLKQFGDRLQKRYATAGLPHRTGGPEVKEDGETFPPPSFNLASALHHACGAVSFVYECPVGVRTEPYSKPTHEQILDLQLLMCDELLNFAVEQVVKWTR